MTKYEEYLEQRLKSLWEMKIVFDGLSLSSTIEKAAYYHNKGQIDLIKELLAMPNEDNPQPCHVSNPYNDPICPKCGIPFGRIGNCICRDEPK